MPVDHAQPILVTAASGKTGRAIVREIAKRGGVARAFIRRESAAQDLRADGAAEVVIGDLLDERALRAAAAGCGQVMHVCPPMHPAEEDLGRRLISICASVGVERLVLYSVLHPVIAVPHHRRKLAVETALIGSPLRYTILQPARYMQHLASIWGEIVTTGVHAMPFSVDAWFSLVDLNDLAEAAARVLLQPGHDFATYQLCGPELLSQVDCADILSKHLGRPVIARAKPIDEAAAAFARNGMPEARIETMRIMNAHYDLHGLVGNANALRALLGREPTAFASYVARDFQR